MMKQISEHKVKELLVKTQANIDKYQKLANNVDNEDFMYYDREYAKSVAQYNILLEVLR